MFGLPVMVAPAGQQLMATCQICLYAGQCFTQVVIIQGQLLQQKLVFGKQI